MNLDWSVLLQPESLIALGTLTLLEIVLGIDNILFISIVSGKLPKELQRKARVVGLALALIFRLILLSLISYLVQFSDPLFTIFDRALSGRDLILLGGGIFLLVKTIREIHHKAEGEVEGEVKKKPSSFGGAIVMIILVDMVFSFDSILTAVGMVDQLSIMITAVVISMIIMLVFVNKISEIIERNPSIQMLALSFLILIAFVLILDGIHVHIDRGFVYFALFFSLLVEILNIRTSRKRKSPKPE